MSLNLSYADELVKIMYGDKAPDFGAASDGMILSSRDLEFW